MAAKDLTAIGLEILQTARNELYLNLPYLDVALCSLDFQPGGGVTRYEYDAYGSETKVTDPLGQATL